MQAALRKDVEPGALTARHVLIVVTGILMCFGPATMVFNTWSVLVVPVCDNLDVSTNAFTLYVSIMMVSMAFMALFAGNLMERFDLRLVLSITCALCAIGIFLCAFYTEVWQFYLSGILEGLGVCVPLSLGAPTLINRWYRRHMGLLIGVCVACTGLGAAVWNLLSGVLLSEFDWRMCYLVFGIVGAAISIPPCLFFVRSYPEDVGLTPFGVQDYDESTEEKQDRSITPQQAFHMPAFILLCITIALTNGISELGNYFATYVYHLSDIGALGVTVASAVIMASVITACLQAAQAGGKIGLGQIADHSLRAALVIACVCGIMGTLFVWKGPMLGSVAMNGGSVLFGVFYAATNVLGPTIARYLFGPRYYTPIYARAAVFISVSPAFFVQLFAWLSDVSWDILFGCSAILIFATLVCALLLIGQIKRVRHTTNSTC